jgi:hypothetical protein
MLFFIVAVRRWLPTTVTLSVLVWSSAAMSAPAASEGIALVSIDVSTGVNVKREDLESAVMKGLAVAGRPMVTPDDAKARAAEGKTDLICQSAQCWTRLGALTNAGYLVAGSAVRDGDSFRVRFRLVRASDGSTLASEDNACEVADCSVAELARRSARELVRQTLGRAGESAALDPAPRGAPPTAVIPPAVQADRPMPMETPRRRWVWPVLAGVGAAGIAAGVVFMVTDNKTIPGLGGRRLDHGLLWGPIAVGAGAILGGVSLYYILRDSGDQGSQVAVGLSPVGLTAAGRF